MDADELREIAVHVYNSDHGDFLKAFADAYTRADPYNERILRQAWLTLIQKYGLEEEYERAQRGREVIA